MDKTISKKPQRSRVDTKRLEYFADVDQFRYVLKHPVMSSFLEMQLNNLKTGYIVEFLLYFSFVLIIFKFFGERFTSIKQARKALILDKNYENFPIKLNPNSDNKLRKQKNFSMNDGHIINVNIISYFMTVTNSDIADN